MINLTDTEEEEFIQTHARWFYSLWDGLRPQKFWITIDMDLNLIFWTEVPRGVVAFGFYVTLSSMLEERYLERAVREEIHSRVWHLVNFVQRRNKLERLYEAS